MRSPEEIADELARVDLDAAAGGPSKWPGMSYEMGVANALNWALGDQDEAPMDD